MKADGDGQAMVPKSTQDLSAELKKQILDQKSQIRAFLTADVLSFVRKLVDRALAEDGEVYLALYELHDPELIDLLKAATTKKRIHLILSTAGSKDPNKKGTAKEDRQPVVWDVENNDARMAIHRIQRRGHRRPHVQQQNPDRPRHFRRLRQERRAPRCHDR